MKISGFTIIKNGITLDYPFLESIQSILPVCDELIVAVGDCQDETRNAILGLNNDKIKIIDTVWDKTIRKGGQILAIQTDLAKSHITGDWGFYIQADEVMHEKYVAEVIKSCKEYLNDPKVEGLAFSYKHFYGSYDYVGDSREWYRREVRVIRNWPEIQSFGDAQGFRKVNGKKLRVKLINAEIYHYGYVRTPNAQQMKAKLMNPFWHDDEWMKENVKDDEVYAYQENLPLKKFEGSHPKYLNNWIKRASWNFHYKPELVKVSFKEKFSNFMEFNFGIRPWEYKNYKLIN